MKECGVCVSFSGTEAQVLAHIEKAHPKVPASARKGLIFDDEAVGRQLEDVAAKADQDELKAHDRDVIRSAVDPEERYEKLPGEV